MQLDENKVTEIFFILDEFSKNFHQTVKKHSVGDGKRHRDKPNRLSDAKLVITNSYSIYLVANDKQMITEVEMTALPKALYILFLRHPDGIRIKNLYSYKTELADNPRCR